MGNMASIKQCYGEIISVAAAQYGHRPEVLAGIMMRESRGGDALTPPGPAGTGDGGHGRGLMQIDDRAFPSFCAGREWQDPEANVRMGALVLANKRDYLSSHSALIGSDLERAAIAAYNCGEGNVAGVIRAQPTATPMGDWIDGRTAHGDYSKAVLAYAQQYAQAVS